MKEEATIIAELFGALCASTRLLFPVQGSKLNAPNRHGVYVIYSPDGHVMHVGRTVRGKDGLVQRLNNHLQGKSSFTRKQFNRAGGLLRGTHTYAFLEVADPRTRCLLESYAIGCLCPSHLGLGDTAS